MSSTTNALVPVCDNCGAEKHGRFCAICGQNDRDYNRSLFSVIFDFFRELFEVDSKFGRTLKTMFLEPGVLAIEFRNNRRANYITPIRLYLFSSILFFFMVSLLAQRTVEPPPFELKDLAEIREEAQAARESVVIKRLSEYVDQRTRYFATQIYMRPEEATSKQFFELLTIPLMSDKPVGERYKRALPYIVKATYQPRQWFDDFLNNLPVVMFLLLPLLVLMLALFNAGKGIRLVYLFIFAMHAHTVFFLVRSVSLFFLHFLIIDQTEYESLISAASWAGFVINIGLFVHTYIAYKRFFGDSHAKSIFKFLGLSILYWIVVVVGILAYMVFTIVSS